MSQSEVPTITQLGGFRSTQDKLIAITNERRASQEIRALRVKTPSAEKSSEASMTGTDDCVQTPDLPSVNRSLVASSPDLVVPSQEAKAPPVTSKSTPNLDNPPSHSKVGSQLNRRPTTPDDWTAKSRKSRSSPKRRSSSAIDSASSSSSSSSSSSATSKRRSGLGKKEMPVLQSKRNSRQQRLDSRDDDDDDDNDDDDDEDVVDDDDNQDAKATPTRMRAVTDSVSVPVLNLSAVMGGGGGGRQGKHGGKRKSRAKQMGLGVGVSGNELTFNFPAAQYEGVPIAHRGTALWGEDDSDEELSEASLGEYSEPNLDTFALSSDEDNATFTPRLFRADSVTNHYNLDSERTLASVIETPHFKPIASPSTSTTVHHQENVLMLPSSDGAQSQSQVDINGDEAELPPLAGFVSPLPSPNDYFSQAVDCLLQRFTDVQRQLGKLQTSMPAKDIHSLYFRIAELQSENGQLLHENKVLKQRNAELQSSAERRSAFSQDRDTKTKSELRQEIRRLKNANADYVKNERAVSKLIAELGVWKERSKTLEAQLAGKKRPTKPV